MDGIIELNERREHRRDDYRARQGNAFIALADQMESAGGDVRDLVASLLMASVSLLVESAEADEARRMAEGVARAYPGMVEALLRARGTI
jgi:hypothetical protein